MFLRTRNPEPGTRNAPRPGYVLIAVLIVIVVLSLAAYRFTDAMTAEHRAGARTADYAQARAAAVSGVHYAMAVLSDRETFATQLNGNPLDAPGAFSDITVRAGTGNSKKETRFSIVSVALVGPGTYEQRFGVTDEGGKLNPNAMIAIDKTGAALFNALLKLPNMTPEVADAIVDWVDADDTPGQIGMTGGAENTYYTPLGYRCKNGPLNSIDELLLVKGVTPQLLYGTDQNRNGTADDGAGQGLDRGWSDYLTAHGRELNVDSTGTLRIYVNGDDLKGIYAALVPAVGEDMAAYMMAVKLWGKTALDANNNLPPPKTNAGGKGGNTGGKGGNTGGKGGNTGGKGGKGGNNQPAPQPVEGSMSELVAAVGSAIENATSSGGAIASIIDLVHTRVTLPKAADAEANAPQKYVNSPVNDTNRLGELLPTLLDKVATKEAVEVVPRINVNTAPREVLLGLPGLVDADVDAMESARAGLDPTAPATTTGAWLVSTAGLTPAKFKAVEKFVTGSSMVYRVQAVGYLTGGGPVARVEAVIDTNLGNPRILYFRDLGDLDSPRGFQPPKR